MRIGQAAKSAGVPARTVRFWEDEQIVPAPQRTASGYRDYTEHDVNRLLFVRRAQAAGLSLTEIAGTLSVRRDGPPCQHVTALLAQRRDEVAERIESLRNLQNELDALIHRASTLDEAACNDDEICHVLPLPESRPGQSAASEGPSRPGTPRRSR